MLSLACGAVSMTVAKSSLFEGLRNKVAARWPMAGKGMSCPYCTSHWVAFLLAAVYFPKVRFIASGWAAFDLFVIAMAMVALSAVTARVIFYTYSAMGQKE